MIKINKITRGRFGNRILQYNSAYQLAHKLDTDIFCDNWEGFKIFDLNISAGNKDREEKLLTCGEFLNSSWNEIKDLHDKVDLVIDDPAYLLHNVFFQLTQVPPRDILKLNPEFKITLPEDSINVGIHIRGDDIIERDGNGGREIHPFSYYRDAVELIEKEYPETQKKYFICTDDINFSAFKETFSHLHSAGKEVFLGVATANPSKINHILDFSLLSECDILIASSSTYAVCAGFLGKSKKIIHSNEWLEKNINHEPWHKKPVLDDARERQLSFDNFWVKVAEGGNEFYNAWKFV